MLMEGIAEVPTKVAFRRGKDRVVPGDFPLNNGIALNFHNPEATIASRGCSEDCYFCGVPMTDGKLSLLPEFPVRPVLCDNNLSALPAKYQDYIIERYHAEGVRLKDANSGFEPKTFDTEVYRRWKPLMDAGSAPWRFGYDSTDEAPQVRRVMKMLKDEPAKRKRPYVLIGNEPFADCMARIEESLDNGCEPHVQAYLSLNSLTRDPRARFDWTEQKLDDVMRWANGWVWRRAPFNEYDRHRKNAPKERFDSEQGLFV